MKLQTYLNRHGLTSTEFAARLGVARITVDRYIRNVRFPNARTLRRIHALTEGAVSLEDFDFPPDEHEKASS